MSGYLLEPLRQLRAALGFNPYNSTQGLSTYLRKLNDYGVATIDLAAHTLRPGRLPSPGLDFLCIGAQKAGTTWLHALIRDHATDICSGAEKELHHFDLGRQRTLRSYLATLRDHPCRLAGEFAPDYSILPPWKIDVIGRLWPEIRVFFIARNPIERSWSAAKMEVCWLTGRQADEVGADEFIAYVNGRRCRRRSDYLRIEDNWSRLGARNFRVLFYDDLVAKPLEFVAEITRFIGLAADEEARILAAVEGQPRAFEGPKAAMPPAVRSRLLQLEGQRATGFLARHRRTDLVNAWLRPGPER